MKKVLIGVESIILLFRSRSKISSCLILILVFGSTLTAQQLIFGGAGAIEEWGYTSSYYESSIAAKGINLGGIVGLSEETYFRLNLGFLSGTSSYSIKTKTLSRETSTEDEVKIKNSFSVFPIEILYLPRFPIGKAGAIYPGVGLGLHFGGIKSSGEIRIKGREINIDTTIERPSISVGGFGMPIIIGIEKNIAGENVKLFVELQKTFYLSAKESGEESGKEIRDGDTLTVKEEYSGSSYLSGAGRVRVGVAFMIGVPTQPKVVQKKGRRSRIPPTPTKK